MSSPEKNDQPAKKSILIKLEKVHKLLTEIEQEKRTINAGDDAFFQQVYDYEFYLSDILDGKLAYSQLKIRPLLDQVRARICQKTCHIRTSPGSRVRPTPSDRAPVQKDLRFPQRISFHDQPRGIHLCLLCRLSQETSYSTS